MAAMVRDPISRLSSSPPNRALDSHGHGACPSDRNVRESCLKGSESSAWHPEHGKGSHGTLYLNGRLTTVCDLKRELKKGTLHGMLAQLAIELKDLLED